MAPWLSLDDACPGAEKARAPEEFLGWNVPQAPFRTDRLTVLYFAVDFKGLQECGKGYPWPRVERCPECGGRRLQGHGYARRYFDGEADALWVKRYRCPDCGAIHTSRPEGHWRRFLAGWQAIVESLTLKLQAGHWSERFSRQRQEYWWNGFLTQVRRDGLCEVPLVAGLRRLLDWAIIATTHSLKYFEIHTALDSSNLTFAFSPPTGWR